MPRFNHDWGGANLPNAWLPWTRPLIGKPSVHYLEIGTFEGMSLCWMFEHILTHPTSHATVIDPFCANPGFANGAGGEFGDYERLWLENTAPWRDRITVIKGFSQDDQTRLDLAESVSHFGRFDLAYIDGNHDWPAPYKDAELVHEWLKTGGILVFDDTPWFGPRKGLFAFLANHPLEYDWGGLFDAQALIVKR